MKRKSSQSKDASSPPEKKAAIASSQASTTNTSAKPTVIEQTSEMQEHEFIASIEKDLETSIAAVANGSHTEISRRSAALIKARDKKKAASDRHRKLQIKNINELYDFELQEADAIFQVSTLLFVATLKIF